MRPNVMDTMRPCLMHAKKRSRMQRAMRSVAVRVRVCRVFVSCLHQCTCVYVTRIVLCVCVRCVCTATRRRRAQRDKYMTYYLLSAQCISKCVFSTTRGRARNLRRGSYAGADTRSGVHIVHMPPPPKKNPQEKKTGVKLLSNNLQVLMDEF